MEAWTIPAHLLGAGALQTSPVEHTDVLEAPRTVELVEDFLSRVERRER
jgi:hypothetical protein